MSRIEFVEHIGEKNIAANVQDALKRAHEIDARLAQVFPSSAFGQHGGL
jgi:hypothetical protein